MLAFEDVDKLSDDNENENRDRLQNIAAPEFSAIHQIVVYSCINIVMSKMDNIIGYTWYFGIRWTHTDTHTSNKVFIIAFFYRWIIMCNVECWAQCARMLCVIFVRSTREIEHKSKIRYDDGVFKNNNSYTFFCFLSLFMYALLCLSGFCFLFSPETKNYTDHLGNTVSSLWSQYVIINLYWCFCVAFMLMSRNQRSNEKINNKHCHKCPRTRSAIHFCACVCRWPSNSHTPKRCVALCGQCRLITKKARTNIVSTNRRSNDIRDHTTHIYYIMFICIFRRKSLALFPFHSINMNSLGQWFIIQIHFDLGIVVTIGQNY